MMWRAVVLLLGVLAPVLCQAQSVSVRSGEHENFTRLVFDLPKRVDWDLQKTANQAFLRLSSADWTYDTSAVFDRIPRERVTDVTADPEDGRIMIALGCPCDVSGFWHGRAMLVIDVREIDPTQKAKAAQSDEPSSVLLQQLETGFASPSASARLVQERFASRMSAFVPGRPEPNGSTDAGSALRESQERLVQQFSRAASQGLLSLNSPLSERAAMETSQPKSQEPRVRTAPEATSKPDSQNSLRNVNLNAHSSIDLAFLETLTAQTDELEKRTCLDPDLVDVTAWANDQPFSDQVGPLRAKLFSEFDQQNPETAVNLAKLYLHFGFGAEAEQVLNLLPEEWPDQEILGSLAAIMQKGHAADASVLGAHAGCASAVALWAILSHDRLPGDLDMDIDAALSAFSGLPQHLRAYLGPVLTRRFLEAGMTNESDRVLRILNRSEDTISPESQFAQAELELASGQSAVADQRLDEVVATSSEPSARALVRQIESKLASDLAVSYDIAQLAGAYAHEHAGGDLGPQLNRAHILALAASGAYQEAFEELERASSLKPPILGDIRADMARLVTRDANDVDFLRYALSGQFGPPKALAAPIALEVARRLLNAGFPSAAVEFLRDPGQGSVSRDIRLLKARIALAQERPRQAEVELLGLSGKEVNLLRAKARSMTGAHAQAQDLYRSAGLEDEAAREAWLAADWQGVNGGQRAVGTDGNGAEDAPAVDPTPGVLEKNRALLEIAGQTRASLEEMLAATPAPTLPTD